MEVAEDRQDGRAALRAVGRQEEGEGDQEQVGARDQTDGLTEGLRVQAFFDAVEGRHGSERGSMFMGTVGGGVKRKRPREALAY